MKNYVVFLTMIHGRYDEATFEIEPRYCGPDIDEAWKAVARLAATARDNTGGIVTVWVFEGSERVRHLEFETANILLSFIDGKNLLETA